MNKIIMLIMVLCSGVASAKDESKTKSFRGKLTMHMLLDNSKTAYTVDTKLVVNTWAQGKVLMVFAHGGYEYYRCPDVARTFVGYETAFNSYDLYLVDNANQSPTPSTASAIGNLIISDNRAYLQFLNGLNSVTTGGSVKCTFTIAQDQSVEFKAKR